MVFLPFRPRCPSESRPMIGIWVIITPLAEGAGAKEVSTTWDYAIRNYVARIPPSTPTRNPGHQPQHLAVYAGLHGAVFRWNLDEGQPRASDFRFNGSSGATIDLPASTESGATYVRLPGRQHEPARRQRVSRPGRHRPPHETLHLARFHRRISMPTFKRNCTSLIRLVACRGRFKLRMELTRFPLPAAQQPQDDVTAGMVSSAEWRRAGIRPHARHFLHAR